MSGKKLHDAGLSDFFNHDVNGNVPDGHALARLAFSELAVTIDGRWESIVVTILTGVMSYMRDRGHLPPSKQSLSQLKTMIDSGEPAPTPDVAGQWFDEAYPVE
ncbi:MAG: hypothetical protein KF838_04900 [Phycisphaeraceae bacterium]|nr:MAG: hypothetical protein KF838_04900 [Phycisphaeraceae bacterium]